MLPPGIDATRFAAALAAFAKVVGAEWVFTQEDDVDLYRDPYSPVHGEPEERVASAAVAPDRVEQVQEIVRIANRYSIPLYPVSTGRNLGYGGAAPVYSGSVVVDLKRMNRILNVDEDRANCLVEPGVSYFDMYRHLRNTRSNLWIDCPDPGWGSLIGNALDHGVGYTAAQQRAHFDAHCGMEVVLPNGELLRTGMGALPNADSWQDYKMGLGPWIDGLFAQSNFGIVTKMGFWLMPRPEAFLKGMVVVPRLEDIIPLVKVVNELENKKIFTGMPDFFSPAFLSPGLAGLDLLQERGPPPKASKEHVELVLRFAPPEQVGTYALRNNIPCWGCYLNFYGPEKVIRAQWEHAAERLQRAIPNARLKEHSFHKLPLPDVVPEEVRLAEFGIPSLRAFSAVVSTPWRPNAGTGHFALSPVIPRTGDAVLKALSVFNQIARDFGVEVVNAAAPLTMYERSFLFVLGFVLTKDPAHNQNIRRAFLKLLEVSAENGWGEYRAPAVFMDELMDVYSFNNHALLRFHETVKDAIDPNGVISPGRYGIWPKHLRAANKRTKK